MVRLLDKATVLNRVYASNLPSRAKTVMFYLVNRSNKELSCFPAVPTIAKETGLSERTVQRALKELCEEGYVEKTPRYRENGGQSSNLFKLIIKEETKADESDNNVIDSTDHNAVMRTESLRANDSNVEKDIPKMSGCYQGMRTIDFSFFDKGLLSPDCHRGGDICIPP